MASKYDAYWQSKLEAILALFDDARLSGESGPLDLSDLHTLSDRESWRGTLEIMSGQPVRDTNTPLHSLGRALGEQLPAWAGDFAWRVAISRQCQLTVEQVDPQNLSQKRQLTAKQVKAADRESKLAELFHLVRSLIPKDQRLFTASPDMTVAEAVRRMEEHSFSQLPVLAGDAVLGVFSFRSLASHLMQMGRTPADVRTLPVDEFTDELRYVQLSDDWGSTLEYLNSDDAVLVGNRDRLHAILTPMDVLNYLHDIARPFVIMAEIELSLRRIIEACTGQDRLRECVQNSLSSVYTADKLPAQLADMTFNDYVQIIGCNRNWPYFAAAFGEGEWQRRSTTDRLKQVGTLRNEVFHFRRTLTADDHKVLSEQRAWLQMKARSFEARHREPRPVKFEPQQAPGGAPMQEPVPEEPRTVETEPPQPAGETATNAWGRQRTSAPTPRQEKYQAFFAALLTKVKTALPNLTTAKKAYPQNWFNYPIGRSGFYLAANFALNSQFRIEIYVDTGDQAKNKAAFDALQEDKDRLEALVGQPLVWQRLNEEQASRIYYGTDGSIEDDQAHLEQLQDWAVDMLGKFHSAFKPHVQKLKLQPDTP